VAWSRPVADRGCGHRFSCSVHLFRVTAEVAFSDAVGNKRSLCLRPGMAKSTVLELIRVFFDAQSRMSNRTGC